MILYFSATGNSKFVAETLAHATEDSFVSMVGIAPEVRLDENEVLGIVTPTYYWGLPSVVNAFLEKLNVLPAKHNYLFSVSTYGTTPGQTDTFIQEIFRKKGLSLDASYCIKMPDSWTPIFDLSDKEKVVKLQQKELPQVETILTHVRARDKGNYMHAKTPMFGAKLWQRFYEKARRTEHLHVESGCIGCGLCARMCPVQAITMQDGHPTWVKEQCAMCLRCLHNCPKFAIQYDNKTQKHGQYRHPNILSQNL